MRSNTLLLLLELSDAARKCPNQCRLGRSNPREPTGAGGWRPPQRIGMLAISTWSSPPQHCLISYVVLQLKAPGLVRTKVC